MFSASIGAETLLSGSMSESLFDGWTLTRFLEGRAASSDDVLETFSPCVHRACLATQVAQALIAFFRFAPASVKADFGVVPVRP